MLRRHVILAVFKRNVASYFSGVLGYLFIIVFVVASAAVAFNPQFFTNNLANLDQLSLYFPSLLLFIIPAITMAAWADEKKLGTDELLFTLPATDLEILLGKYLAVLAVYTIALLFSVTQLGVLAYYADPDWGLLITSYFGYWLAGAALLSAGMFASALTSSVTVAFILGAIICAVPVFIDRAAPTSEFVRDLSLSEQLREFTMGMFPMSGIIYFLSLTILMLYLNLVIITRRHWSSSEGTNMGVQYLVRVISLAVVLISLNVVTLASGAVFDLRYDMTAEKLYTLSPTTRELIDKIDKERPVTIQAYLSPDVPREVVDHSNRLRGMLRQYDRIGGGLIEVRFVDVEPFSVEAEEAVLMGIEPRQVQTERTGRFDQETVYMGAVVSSPYDEVVIPYFDLGMPIEYELTRSIRTVSKEDRLTVGILQTDARVGGGMSMTTFSSSPSWQIQEELEKQYDVVEVSPDTTVSQTEFDVLLAVMPSSMTQPQMANFVAYVRTGKPVVIFDDPLPVFDGGQSAPRQPKPSAGGGGMFGGGQPPEEKADGGRATSLLNELEIAWENGEVVWDLTGTTLHPEFGEVIRPELVFISPKSGVESAFNPDSEISSGLQEALAFFPGRIRPRTGSDLEFTPLLRTGMKSGVLDWNEITQPGFFGRGLTIIPDPVRFADDDAHVIAAQIKSKNDAGEGGINVIYVADVDMISDQLFSIVQGQLYGLRLDNVKFVLNAVDYLAGDESYIELRKRRAQHRTLTRIQQQTDKFRDERASAQEAAEREADEQLEARREALRAEVEAIENDATLTSAEKDQRIRIAQERQQRILDVTEANIDREKDKKIEQIKSLEQRQIRALENGIWIRAVVFPALPAILLGAMVLIMRMSSEQRDIEASRLVKS